jgi:hypothetical protein
MCQNVIFLTQNAITLQPFEHHYDTLQAKARLYISAIAATSSPADCAIALCEMRKYESPIAL